MRRSSPEGYAGQHNSPENPLVSPTPSRPRMPRANWERSPRHARTESPREHVSVLLINMDAATSGKLGTSGRGIDGAGHFHLLADAQHVLEGEGDRRGLAGLNHRGDDELRQLVVQR